MVRLFARSLAVIGLISLLLLSTADAQGRRMMDKGEFLEQNLQAIDEAVGLSEEQSAGVSEILGKQFDDQRTLMAEMREAGRGARGGMREKMVALRAESDEAILGLLSEDQQPKYTAFREAQEEERRSRMQRGGGGRPDPQ